MKFIFTTLFDINYAAKGFAMLSSLRDRARADGIELMGWVLALDKTTERMFHAVRFGGVHVVPLGLLLHQAEYGLRERLKAKRATMEHREFCWMMASVFTEYVAGEIHSNDGSEVIHYVDSDVYWFGSPRLFMEEMEDANLGAIPHRFPPEEVARLEPNGKFNVSVTSFRLKQSGRDALRRWADQCLNWCGAGSGDRSKFEYCGDQGYLDEWPSRYGNRLRVFQYPGLSLAPWNLRLHHVGPGPTIDGLPVVAFHFHEFRDADFLSGYALRDEDRRHIYQSYIEALARWEGIVTKAKEAACAS